MKQKTKKRSKPNRKALLRLARRSLFSHAETPQMRTLSVAVATFIAFVPLYGIQTLLGIAVAFALRLNKVLVIVLINVITPYPLVPFVMYASFRIGGWLVAQPVQVSKNENFSWQLLRENLVQYLSGGLILATVMAGLFTLVSYPLFIYLRNRRIAKTPV